MEVVYCIALGFVLGLLVGLAIASGDQYNEHAYLLGKVVMAKKYEASNWEAYRVVNVSWHGSLKLRSMEDPAYSFWMDMTRRPGHLGEVIG